MTAEIDAWLAVDPDPVTRAELEALVAGGDVEALADRFAHRLAFGTAGLRGALGAGPNRMNRVVVRQATAGLVRHLSPSPTVVIGYDARTNSDTFAADAAAVVAAAGGRALCFDGVVPTPLLAFAVRHLAADAGVMVTASHNPPGDNGYKVYLDDGAQLVPPHDAAIEAEIEAVGPSPRDLPPPSAGGTIELLGDELVVAYLDRALPTVRHDLSALDVVYTPLHGVGADLMQRALERVGGRVQVVAAQAGPDPTFATVTFPNPEEPGALDLALAQAQESGADLVLAHDPDADRLGVAIPSGGGWRVLSGNEIGWLLADHVLRTGEGDDRLVVTTVVSSAMLAAIADAYGVHHEVTLTGFKWIMNAAHRDPGRRFVFGYEEALGYAVGDAVRDKDGITAGVAFLDLAAGLAEAGHSIADRLDELAGRFGRHRTSVLTVRTGSQADAAALLAGLRAAPPREIGGRAIEAVVDHLVHPTLPPTDLLRFDLAGRARVMVRPSGTEPKLKIYLELVTEPDDPGGEQAFARLEASASSLVTID